MRCKCKRARVAILIGPLLAACSTNPHAASGTGSGAAGNPGGSGGQSGSSALGDAAGAVEDGATNDAGDGGDGAAECSRDEHCGNTGAHCDPETNRCVKGCAEGDDCASGVCLPTHDCARCLTDAECAEHRLCGSGVCSEPCGDCANGLTCCEQRCVDNSRDIANCGACGAACDRKEFCATTGCLPSVIANVCSLGLATALLDGAAPDEQAAADVLAALQTHCSPAPATRSVDQLTADVINAANGRVVASGGELLVLAGGPYFNRTAGFLEKQRDTPVYNAGMFPGIQFIRSADDSIVSTGSLHQSTESHDMIVIQMGRERTTGTLALLLYGFHPNGTLAAAWHFAHVMAPDLASYTDAYYVYDWSDTNGDHTPNDGDAWKLLGSGR